jgi:hypothetical protein
LQGQQERSTTPKKKEPTLKKERSFSCTPPFSSRSPLQLSEVTSAKRTRSPRKSPRQKTTRDSLKTEAVEKRPKSIFSVLRSKGPRRAKPSINTNSGDEIGAELPRGVSPRANLLRTGFISDERVRKLQERNQKAQKTTLTKG